MRGPLPPPQTNQSRVQHNTMESDLSYFSEGPPGLPNSCDILLRLDDGKELSAHSQILARCMSVLTGMIDGGPLSSASAANVVNVPFSECSLEEAKRFLSAVYSCTPSKHIEDTSALPIARLSHKYGGEVRPACDRVLIMTASFWLFCTLVMTDGSSLQYILQNMVRLCDDAFAQKAGINSDPDNFPSYLKVRMIVLWCHTLPSMQAPVQR